VTSNIDRIKPWIEYIDLNRIYITQENFNLKLKVIAAGVKKKVSSYIGRHTFGSSLVDLNIDKKLAQKLLPHGSISSTKIYYHVKDENLDKAMEKFNK
jgi:site-specific recombinase XerD